MADESMQVPAVEKEYLQPDTEIPVKLESLEADGVRPRVGDSVTIRVEGTVKSIENDCAYVCADAINDVDLEEILAEHQPSDENEEGLMRRIATEADQMGAAAEATKVVTAYRERNGRVEKRIVHSSNGPRLRGEPPPDRHFSRGLLRAYYDLECQHGTRFRSTYPKSVIKRVHETAIQRFEQTGQEN